MNAAQALSTIRSLANGVDPFTGMIFPPDSVYQKPDVVRALYRAAEALEAVERKERKKVALPANTGEPWTEDEDRKLLTLFDSGAGLPEIAAKHERTQTGVRARLVKYGRLAA